MKKAANVEIIIVGNEILTGDIADTNTHWLCDLVHQGGGVVSRVTVVPDIVEVVADAVRETLARKADIVFTSGGLGPTADDLTLQAVASGTERALVLDNQAREMVRRQYDRFFAEGIMTQGGLNPAREKMAYLPQGAIPLVNPNGTAPGVLLQLDNTTIVSVPGVPSELQGIINQAIPAFLGHYFSGGEALAKCVAVNCNDESLLEPVLVQIVDDYPAIYTKSLATTIGAHPEMDIIMSISGIGEKATLLESAFAQLCEGLIGLGFAINIKNN